MNEMTIPLPDINFFEIVKEKAEKTIKDYVSESLIIAVGTGQYRPKERFVEVTLNKAISTFKVKNDKLIFISEILIHLANVKDSLKTHVIVKSSSWSNLKSNQFIESIQYELYQHLSSLGYNLDTNAFTTDEVSDITNKVNAIIETLERIKGGQEIIFDRVDELKQDFQEIINSMPQGKKPFFQRMAGIAVTYTGTKGADEIFNAIRPDLKTLLDNGVQLFIG